MRVAMRSRSGSWSVGSSWAAPPANTVAVSPSRLKERGEDWEKLLPDEIFLRFIILSRTSAPDLRAGFARPLMAAVCAWISALRCSILDINRSCFRVSSWLKASSPSPRGAPSVIPPPVGSSSSIPSSPPAPSSASPSRSRRAESCMCLGSSGMPSTACPGSSSSTTSSIVCSAIVECSSAIVACACTFARRMRGCVLRSDEFFCSCRSRARARITCTCILEPPRARTSHACTLARLTSMARLAAAPSRSCPR